MKKIVVTPAGRKLYLSILSKYLIYYNSLNEFDEWHLWCNTEDQKDIEYIYDLEKKHDFIKVVPLPDYDTIVNTCHCDGIIDGPNGMVFAHTIPYFIKADTTDEDSVYLRLDDDIVFIKDKSIRKVFEYREGNTENFLVYGNIVNNSVLSHIHQGINVLPKTHGEVGLDACDPIGLYDDKFAEFVHNNFFEKYNNGLLEEYCFEPYVLKDYHLISIQVISWHGSAYKRFNGEIPPKTHEENYQSVDMPRREGKTNVVFGDSLFCHYSATVNRPHIETTNILSRYVELAKDYLG
jgi:hypothetical protein